MPISLSIQATQCYLCGWSPRPTYPVKAEDLNKPAVPVAYALLILDLAARRGADRARMLAELDIPDALLASADGHLSQLQISKLLYRALKLTQDAALGYEIGLNSNLTSHGFVGYGLLSHSTLREALDFGVKFVTLRTPFLGLRLFTDGNRGVVEVTERIPFGPLRHCTFDLFLVGISRIAQQMSIGQIQAARDLELWFDYAEPPYYAAYRERLPPVRFSMPANQLRFPAELLDRKLFAADPTTAKLVTDQLEREAKLLGYTADFRARVRAALANDRGRYPDLGSTAEKLHLSARTLKRRLQESGTSFQALLDEARKRDSLRLLEDPTLTLEVIAARVGYSDPANFTRAFRKWTGITPSAYRNRAGVRG